jgi:ketosteroid isomerase-like protein
MKTLARLVLPFVLCVCPLRAEEPDDFAAVRAADEARLAATIAGDTLKLSQLLSNELFYAHSDGRVQTKAQFIAAVAGNRIQYASVTPHDLKLQAIAPGAVAMNGRARLVVRADGRPLEFTLRFLAVWRNEDGPWRLLAYQSSQLAETADAAR